MNIEKKITEDHHAQLTVEIEADRLEGMKRRAASKLARRVKIPGFRPGKAPYPVILRQLGEAAILEEAVELLVDEIYPEVIKESGIEPYGPGNLENISSTEPVILEFSVPLEAETTLGDYKSIQKPYTPEIVDEKDIDKVVADLRERNAIVETVERPAELGDLVALKLSAIRLDTDDDQERELIPERTTSIIIRPIPSPTDEEAESKSDEWPYPGFSQQLIGLSADDEKSLEYTFPEDSDFETLRGVTAEFNIKIEAVKSRQLPYLDDEFAKTIGDEFETLEQLQSEIRKSLEAQARASYNESYDEEILDAAIEQTEFQFPPEMVEHEIDTVIKEFGRRLERQGMDLDLYLKTRNLDMDAFRDEVKPVAEDRIKRALFLVEFGKAENIEVKPDELEKEAVSTMDYLYNTLPERDARKLTKRDIYTNIVGNVLADMLSHRSLERFREICSAGLSKEESEETTPGEESLSQDSAEDDKAQMSAPATTEEAPVVGTLTEDSQAG